MKSKPKHLIIDGFNVIHAWPELKEVLDFDINTACTYLTNTVQVIHDSENLHTTIVFDGKGHEISVEHPTTAKSFSLVYTSFSLTADSFIEQYVQKNKNKQTFTITSRDNLLVETISAAGAISMRPEDLKAWVSQCARLQREKLNRHTKKTNKEWKLNNPWEELQ